MRRGFFEDPACCALSSGTRKTRKMSKYKAQTEIWRPRSPALKAAGKWLDRYPDLGRQEQAALMRQFRTLSLAEPAVIIGDVRLSGKLAQFYGDHEPDLEAPLTGFAISLLLPAALAVAGLHPLLS
ncbi:hypothetical protein [Sphingopyxis sp. NFH-91]|uniref:hypothetical protein n=1 Tax=Sphingopyxis sp. NFH-91 TaxID=2744457 RepID=UPI001F383BBE|nr:hypothetical protein [Sphingopyxis sp. NFH-91]